MWEKWKELWEASDGNTRFIWKCWFGAAIIAILLVLFGIPIYYK